MSVSYGLIVSGSNDKCAIIWDMFTGRMVQMLSNHDGPVISVSINQLSGHVMTLTRTRLYLFTVNGVLLASTSLCSPFPLFNSEFTCMFPATVGIAVPTPDWREGVEVVTGHEGGLVCLWKMRREYRPSDTVMEVIYGDNVELESADELNTSNTQSKLSQNYIHRELYVCSTISRVHDERITALKLCPATSSTSTVSSSNVNSTVKIKTKKSSLISHQNEYLGSQTDLLVGDGGGVISRWACQMEVK